MRAPDFWTAAQPTLIARLLAPLSRIYGALTAWRMAQPGITAAVPVICVGNLVAGGAGKTPTVLALNTLLREMGQSPVALARGYGGKLAGPIRVCAQTHSAADVGDEPLLLAARMPVVVARQRPAGAALAVDIGADVIVMDDGLQNPSLAKTLRLAVIDGTTGIGNGLCLPAGPLRAPFDRQMRHVDALILIGQGAAGDNVAAQAGKPVYRARLVPAADALRQLAGTRLLAIAGIGRPEKFNTTLREAGGQVLASRFFADHHPYTAADVASMLSEAKAAALTIATTQKDWMKLQALWPENEPVLVVPVALVFDEPERMRIMLKTALTRSPGKMPAQDAKD